MTAHDGVAPTQARGAPRSNDVRLAGGDLVHPLGEGEIQYFCWFGAAKIDEIATRVQLWQT